MPQISAKRERRGCRPENGADLVDSVPLFPEMSADRIRSLAQQVKQ